MNNKVILVSIDGMRPDGLTACGHPFVKELMEKSSYSMNASSMVPSITLPCHLSMFYGVTPQRHGVTTNTFTPFVRPLNGICEQLSAIGKKCAAFYNWEPMRHVWNSDCMKYSSYIEAYEEENSDLLLTEQLLALMQSRKPDFLYCYLVETDSKGGHDHGWMSEEYIKQLYNAVDCAQKIYRAMPSEYSLIITADHGGHDRTHGDTCPEDMTIPMFFLGNAFEPGRELENISLLDLAPTIASLTGAARVREWEGRSLA